MKIIQLHTIEDVPQVVYVNADHIIAFQTYKGATYVKMAHSGDVMKVKETIEQIVVKLGVTVR